MEFAKEFDKLNIPMYICDRDWRVLYRNRACRKYTNSPRVNGDFGKCFSGSQKSMFPVENGGICFLGCFIRDTYKTALCFEYHGYAVVMFPLLLDFDLLFSGLALGEDKKTADTLREVFDSISAFGIFAEDRYGTIEKIRKHTFSAIDNYVTLSMFDTEKRVLGSFLHIYKFFFESVLKTANKAGYKIETDFSGILEFGDAIYTDTTYFSMVLSSLLLFCLAISEDNTCLIVSEHLGDSVRNMIKFTYKQPILYGKAESSLKDFMRFNPAEYINFMPFEELCRSLGWRLGYSASEEERLNVCIYFDIDNDNVAKFRSAGTARFVTPEEIVSDIVSKILTLM